MKTGRPADARCGGLLLGLALLVASGAACAQGDDAREWLDKMGKAVEFLNYKGTFVHTVDNTQQTLEVVHRVKDGRISERLVAMDGEGREIIRDNEEVRCTIQADKAVLVETLQDQSPLRSALPAYTDDLDRYYDFLIGERIERVADRKAVQISVRPKDAHRYGYELWLDKETAMPLHCKLVDTNGRVIETIHFTRISYPADIPDSALAPSLAVKDFKLIRQQSPGAPAAESTDAHWEADEVPVGFKLTVANRQPIGEASVEHLVYTDGLAAVSVFVESQRDGQEAPLLGRSSIGAAQAFGTSVDGHHITALGEVPAATVEMIARSMHPPR